MSIEQLSNLTGKAIEDSKADTYDLLKETPEEKEKEIPIKEEEELKPEDDLLKEEKPAKEEEKEDELELEEEEVPEDKLDSIITPPKRKEILAAYPDLFKKFPYLESAFYREQQFTEIYPTLDEAKETKERVQVLEKFEEQLFSGKADTVLQSVKEADPEAFGRVVDNLLPDLAKIDNNAYLHLVANMGKQTIMAMMGEAQRSENEQLKAAATILHQFLFGNTQWAAPTTYGKPQTEDSDTKKLQDERAQLIQDRFEGARSDLETRTDNRIKSTIAQNIDPKNQMSSYVKSKAIDDCMAELNSQIESDTRFRKVLDSLWEKAFDSNFSRASVDEIQKAIISKARALLPETIRSTRGKAIGTGRRSNAEEEKKGPVKGRSTSPSTNNSGKLEIPKGMSTKDFLMQD